MNTTMPETLTDNQSSYSTSRRHHVIPRQNDRYRNYGRWYDSRPYYQSTPYQTNGMLPWAGSYSRRYSVRRRMIPEELSERVAGDNGNEEMIENNEQEEEVVVDVHQEEDVEDVNQGESQIVESTQNWADMLSSDDEI